MIEKCKLYGYYSQSVSRSIILDDEEKYVRRAVGRVWMGSSSFSAQWTACAEWLLKYSQDRSRGWHRRVMQCLSLQEGVQEWVYSPKPSPGDPEVVMVTAKYGEVCGQRLQWVPASSEAHTTPERKHSWNRTSAGWGDAQLPRWQGVQLLGSWWQHTVVVQTTGKGALVIGSLYINMWDWNFTWYVDIYNTYTINYSRYLMYLMEVLGIANLWVKLWSCF